MSKVVDVVRTHELGRQYRFAGLNDIVNIFAPVHNTCTFGCGDIRQTLDAQGVGVGGDANDDMRG